MNEKELDQENELYPREESLKSLYRRMLHGIVTDQSFIQIIAQVVYQAIQATIFQAANQEGYNMEVLKTKLDEVMAEFNQEAQKENN
jgi:hypothetical protein